MRIGQIQPSAPAPASSPSISDILSQAVPAALQLYRERQATKLQMDRARQGLPPLALEFYSPPVRVEAGVDKNTKLLIAGVGAAALLGGLLIFTGRRRRRG